VPLSGVAVDDGLERRGVAVVVLGRDDHERVGRREARGDRSGLGPGTGAGQVDDLGVHVGAAGGLPGEPGGDGGPEAAFPGAGDDDGDAERMCGHEVLLGRCGDGTDAKTPTNVEVKQRAGGGIAWS
jgi:hypothetical protein